MDFRDRPLAITDIETTGLNKLIHEIVEIGLVLARQDTLEIIETWSAKIMPLRIHAAEPEALKVNGYNEAEWKKEAVELRAALLVYIGKTRGAIFTAHNVTFDWGFLEEAFWRTSVRDEFDYHRFDLLTAAWFKSRTIPGITKFRLESLCEFFGIPKEPLPHRALNGALAVHAVFKKLASL